MNVHAWLEPAVTLAVVVLASVAVTPWLARAWPIDAVGTERGRPVPVPIPLRIVGLATGHEMTPREYAAALIALHGVGIVLLLALLLGQHRLPGNPLGLPAVPWTIAVNTAVSFVTNTNWQAYAGESTLSPLSQAVGLVVQNFVSAAVGLATLVVLARGFVRRQSATVGNAWDDVVRGIVFVLLPMAILLALLLVLCGVPQTLAIELPFVPYDPAALPQAGESGRPDSIPLGPVASQTAIQFLGTNGGGFYNANSAHPLANPSPLSNALSIVAMLLLPVGGCLAFGRWVGDRRQGQALLATMALLFVPFLAIAIDAETRHNPDLDAAVVQASDADADGGSLEGREQRFGTVASALFGVATTATSCGGTDFLHDSATPIGGLILLWMMHLGEVVFGGVGSGLTGLLAYAILAVFVAGLLVGRSPEYLGKRIEAEQMKPTMVVLLVPPVTTLLGTALAAASPEIAATAPNPGPHAFSELLYAFASAANNNGSAMAGLDATTPFWTLGLAAAMLVCRIVPLLAIVALAGSLAARRPVAAGPGTLPTHGPMFVVLLAGTVVLVGALAFVPALALGPIAEALGPASATGATP